MGDLPGDKSDLYRIIKKEVENTFGRSITTSGDCNFLCEEIYKKTGNSLNQNTLRRFFGLVKAEYPASVSTLNILANYCGFDSTEEILSLRLKTIDNALQEEDLSILYYFIEVFKITRVKDSEDETFFTFVYLTINYLQKKPEIVDKFQRAIAKIPNGQHYYYEQFVNIDKLNSFYGIGLRYYINENRTSQGQIFGYSLLCARDWLVGDDNALKKNFSYIAQQYLSNSTEPLAYGRYFAAKLFHADIFESGTEPTLKEAYNIHTVIKISKNKCCLYNCFEYPLSWALILTRHYEEALYYINYAFASYSEKDNPMYHGAYQQLLLLKSTALFRMNMKEDANISFQELRPIQFYSLSKKTDTILYLLLAYSLRKITHKQCNQIQELIQETGFSKLISI